MLKTVASITNAIGALNYKGTWNASTNSPALASGVGTKGDYYVVSVAGTTTLDGISAWYVGDWATFNGSVWQRVEGGVDDPAPSLKSNSTTGLMQITGPAAGQTRVVTIPDANATMARTDAAQSFTGDQTLATGNLVIGTSGKGIDFSATPGTGTSELFDDYEEGTWNIGLAPATGAFTSLSFASADGYYVKVGDVVHVWGYFWTVGAITLGTASGQLRITGLPYTVGYTQAIGNVWINPDSGNYNPPVALCTGNQAVSTALYLFKNGTVSNTAFNAADLSVGGGNANYFGFSCSYRV